MSFNPDKDSCVLHLLMLLLFIIFYIVEVLYKCIVPNFISRGKTQPQRRLNDTEDVARKAKAEAEAIAIQEGVLNRAKIEKPYVKEIPRNV